MWCTAFVIWRITCTPMSPSLLMDQEALPPWIWCTLISYVFLCTYLNCSLYLDKEALLPLMHSTTLMVRLIFTPMNHSHSQGYLHNDIYCFGSSRFNILMYMTMRHHSTQRTLMLLDKQSSWGPWHPPRHVLLLQCTSSQQKNYFL